MPSPVTSKDAAVTVPMVLGRVTPPVFVLDPSDGSKTTVPAAITATLPKFKSTVLDIAIGSTIVAVAVAEAVAWANVFDINATDMIAHTNSTLILFICFRVKCVNEFD